MGSKWIFLPAARATAFMGIIVARPFAWKEGTVLCMVRDTLIPYSIQWVA